MTIRLSSKFFATLIAVAALLAGWAGAETGMWTHPDGTFHYYHPVSTPGGINWNAAFDSARAKGGYLATLASHTEDSIAFGIVDTSTYWYPRPGSGKLAGPWLGGYQPAGATEPDFGWQWVTGEPFDFRNWTPGGPDNQDGTENALNFGESAGVRVPTWNDLSDADSTLPGYVMELSAESTTIGLTQVSADTSTGYTLFDPMTDRYTYLIDNKGRLIHRWRSTYTPGASVYLLPDGRLLRNCNLNNPSFPGGIGGRSELLDWDGNVVWSYTYSDTLHNQHHDAMMLPNGHLLMIAFELKTRDEAIEAGRDPSRIIANKLWPDHLVEVDTATDSIVWQWHLWDHLIQDFDSTKANYGIVGDHPELFDVNYTDGVMPAGSADWIHANAVDYNSTFDQVVISAYNPGEVWVIDHSTTTAEAASHAGGQQGMGGDLLYRWGNPRTYRAGDSSDQRFFAQHDAQWIRPGLSGAGNIMIFNNQAGPRNQRYSTVDEITPPVDSTGYYTRPEPGMPFDPPAQCWIYRADPPTSFYSSNIAGAQRMPNGNTLICNGANGIFFEVAPDTHRIVWRYVSPMVNGSPLRQGDTVPAAGQNHQNSAFRAPRYPPDYSGLAGKDLTPGLPIERYQPPMMPAPGPLAPINHGISRTLTPTLRVGTIPNYGCDSIRFRLYRRGDTTPIQERTSAGDTWTVAELPPGRYDWDCQGHNADGWSPYFTPRWDFIVVSAPSGWSSSQPLPLGLAGRSIKAGGWLTYDATNSIVYAAKGYKTGEFYRYNPLSDSWYTLAAFPIGPEGKPAYKGSVGCADGSGSIYATKGNNKQAFYRYDAAVDSWYPKKDVPLGPSNKKVKGGTDIVWAYEGATGSPYLLKGYKNEFYRYDVAADSWHALAPAPIGSNQKWDKGSWLAYDDANGKIYAFKPRNHEFYRYSPVGDSWSGLLKAMPIAGSAGAKKAKDGGCGTYDNGCIYALKGGNTTEFWKYAVAGDSWSELETIPRTGSGLKKKKVKSGADIVGTGSVIYATKGNNSLEFWRYGLPLAMGLAPAGRSGAMADIARLPGRLSLNVAPNPITSRAVIAYSVPLAGPVSLKLYDVSGSLMRALAGGYAGAGSHTAQLNGTGLPHGVYLIRLESGGCHVTKKLTLE